MYCRGETQGGARNLWHLRWPIHCGEFKRFANGRTSRRKVYHGRDFTHHERSFANRRHDHAPSARIVTSEEKPVPPLIDVRDLKKTYLLGDIVVHALQGVTLTIERGTFVAIMGESGSGKSTLLNLLGCLDRPTSGRYLLDSIPVETMDRDQLAEIRNQKIGFIFQNFNLLPRMDALENVELPLLYKYSETPNGNELGQRALADVGLAGRELNFPGQLSGGQQQRVAIARALINKPAILLADEPTGALDSHNGAEIMKIFQRLNRTQGITIVMVTHSDEIAGYADRIIGFRDGLIVSDKKVANRRCLWRLSRCLLLPGCRHEALDLFHAYRVPCAEDEQAPLSTHHAGYCDRSCLSDRDGCHRLRRHTAHSTADREHRKQHHYCDPGEYE